MKENLERLYEKAVMIAQEAHKGQLDKGGNPYIEHPLYVASQVETPELKMIAVLHDTLEDSNLTADDLKEAGLPEEVVEAIAVLTHEDGNEEAYLDYIRRVADNKMAARVKKEGRPAKSFASFTAAAFICALPLSVSCESVQPPVNLCV